MTEDIKEIFSKNLNRLMDLKGTTVANISEKTSIPYSTVNDWKNGKKMPRGGGLQKLAEFFKVNISDLTSNTDQEYYNNSNNINVENNMKFLNDYSSNAYPADKVRRIPIIGEIACGDPILTDENIEGYREELTELLPYGKLFYLKTKGDSMTPTIPLDSYVLIREQPEVEDGEIAAVLVNGDTEATLKRIKHQGNIMMLVADNPNYPPYIVTEDNQARIIGKAVKVSFDL